MKKIGLLLILALCACQKRGVEGCVSDTARNDTKSYIGLPGIGDDEAKAKNAATEVARVSCAALEQKCKLLGKDDASCQKYFPEK